MESLPENYLLSRLLIFEQMQVSGKIEIWANDGEQCIRRIEFEKAYICHHIEEMDTNQALPMLTTISISPLRLDINRKVRIDRRLPETSGSWEKYTPPKEEKAKQEKELEEVKITVLIEMPYSKIHMRRTYYDKIGIRGHTAMAVGDRFFDYGPDEGTLGQVNEQDYDADFNKDGDKNDILDRIDIHPTYKFSQEYLIGQKKLLMNINLM